MLFKYSAPPRTRLTTYQPTSSVCVRACVCTSYFYSKSGEWFGGWRTAVTSLFVHFMLSSRTCSWSGCTSGMVSMSAKCRTVHVNRSGCLRTFSTQGHSAGFSSQSVNTFWRRQTCLLRWSHECLPAGSFCVQEKWCNGIAFCLRLFLGIFMDACHNRKNYYS
jgi:hypothetical protein